MATQKNMILRSLFVEPDVDESIRQIAFAKRTTKNELIRDWIKKGLREEKQKDRKPRKNN